MDKKLFVEKKEFEALQRVHLQTKSVLESVKSNSKKLKKQIIEYSNSYNVVLSEINIEIQKLSREKMLAEGSRNMIEISKKTGQIQTANKIKNIITQKISL